MVSCFKFCSKIPKLWLWTFGNAKYLTCIHYSHLSVNHLLHSSHRASKSNSVALISDLRKLKFCLSNYNGTNRLIWSSVRSSCSYSRKNYPVWNNISDSGSNHANMWGVNHAVFGTCIIRNAISYRITGWNCNYWSSPPAEKHSSVLHLFCVHHEKKGPYSINQLRSFLITFIWLLWITRQNLSKNFKGLLNSTTGRRRNNYRKALI